MIPADLQQAILWQTGAGGSRRSSSAAMTELYKAGQTSSQIDLSAYLTVRLPATFAAVSAVLGRLTQEYPDFHPRSMLDIGCGPGTAGWAATVIFPALMQLSFIDHDRRFLDLAQELAQHSSHSTLKLSRSHKESLLRLSESFSEKADLVVSAYCLVELESSKIAQALSQLWPLTSEALVLIEPGTPQGFQRLKQARSWLIEQGASIAAPCTHQQSCPLTENDWCHFKVRLERSRAHLHAKQAKVPFEDESYSYLIAAKPNTALGHACLAKEGQPQRPARILAPPRETKFSKSFTLCAAGQRVQTSFETRNKAAYKKISKDRWGDLLLLDYNDADGEF